MREGGGNCVKYLKKGGRGGETKNLKRKERGKLGQGVGALKRGGWLDPPLRTMKKLSPICNVVNIFTNPLDRGRKLNVIRHSKDVLAYF